MSDLSLVVGDPESFRECERLLRLPPWPPRGLDPPAEPEDGGEGVREPRRQPPLSPAGSAALEGPGSGRPWDGRKPDCRSTTVRWSPP